MSPRDHVCTSTPAACDDIGMVIPLMLATLTDRRDFGDDWLLERKFDGERCVARKTGIVVRLESRNGKDLTATYPEVQAAVAAQRSRDLLLDGEVVAYDGDQTSFTRLQQRLGLTAPSPELVAEYPVVYCVFDLLEVDGEDLTARPLVERRARLTRTIRVRARHWSTPRPGTATRSSVSPEACRSGWEGLIAETRRRTVCRWPIEGLVEAEVRLGAGVRHRRLHRTRRQPDSTSVPSLSVTTSTAPSATPARSAPATPMRYSATSVAGFTRWRWPSRRSSTRDRSPVARIGRSPELVAQIGFAEWTSDARLRQARFLGLRDDKSPAEVVRERAPVSRGAVLLGRRPQPPR